MNYGYPPQPPPGQAAPGGGAPYGNFPGGMPGAQIFQVSNVFLLYFHKISTGTVALFAFGFHQNGFSFVVLVQI